MDWNSSSNNPSELAIFLRKLASKLNNWGLPTSNSIKNNIDNCRHLLKKAYSNPSVNFVEILNIENTLDNLLSEEEIF